MKKNINPKVLLALIIVGIFVLSFATYRFGYNTRDYKYLDHNMMMILDSNYVTAGIYDFLPNEKQKALQYTMLSNTGTSQNIKVIAEIKAFKIGDKVYDMNETDLWKFINKKKVFFKNNLRKQEKPGKKNKTKETSEESSSGSSMVAFNYNYSK
ncbi:hypothetical protein BMS3Abin04_00204 [bacterium BMS3Abin04]|nr:hypothetical protein BMS3Abin04_00204 [bacterium BMS3Abin04]